VNFNIRIFWHFLNYKRTLNFQQYKLFILISNLFIFPKLQIEINKYVIFVCFYLKIDVYIGRYLSEIAWKINLCSLYLNQNLSIIGLIPVYFPCIFSHGKKSIITPPHWHTWYCGDAVCRSCETSSPWAGRQCPPSSPGRCAGAAQRAAVAPSTHQQ